MCDLFPQSKLPVLTFPQASESSFQGSSFPDRVPPPLQLFFTQWAVKWHWLCAIRSDYPSSIDTWDHQERSHSEIKEKQERRLENFVMHCKYSNPLFLSYHPAQLPEQMEGGKINWMEIQNKWNVFKNFTEVAMMNMLIQWQYRALETNTMFCVIANLSSESL